MKGVIWLMDYVNKTIKKILDDLLQENERLGVWKKINKLSVYILALSTALIYIIFLWKNDTSILFENFMMRSMMYCALLSLTVFLVCNNYMKKPREKIELLRQNLMKRIEGDFCTKCTGRCIHKEDFLETMLKEHNVNLYY